MGFLPQSLPFFEIFSFFLPVWIQSGRDKSAKKMYNHTCKDTEGDMGLAAVDQIEGDVPLQTHNKRCEHANGDRIRPDLL